MADIKDALIEKSVLLDNRSNDLSIYFPSEKFLYNRFILPGNFPYTYENLAFSSDAYWDKFIKNYPDEQSVH